MVRDEEVPINPDEICEIYNVPFYENDYINSIDLEMFRNIDMEEVIKFLTQGRGSWNYRPDTRSSSNFNQAVMFPVAKIWMQFLGTRIVLTLNVSNVNTSELFYYMEIYNTKKSI